MQLKFFPYLFVLFCLPYCQIVSAQGTASELYLAGKPKVFQIRVVDLASGDKSSIGSGFQISDEGIVATNFHVIASYVHKPKQFKLEYVYYDGSIGDLELLAIDVVHDLALVQLESFQKDFFSFNEKVLSKGDRVYSMGNPHDLGMTIIEGTYNGLIKKSRYQKILFSGSLNSGMSGGPAMDAEGNIIGINVSKGSEHISFLVPVRELKILLEQYKSQTESVEFGSQIENALLADQDAFFGELLARDWDKSTFMELQLPVDLSPSLKCWGRTFDEAENKYDAVHQHCQSQDEIFINRQLFTGTFAYSYEWMETDELNRFQFYNLLETRFAHVQQKNAYQKKHITNYKCHKNFVELNERSWQISSCIRAYKKYSKLYDAVYAFSSVDENLKGIVIRISTTGISQENAEKLLAKMAGELTWKP